MSFADSLNDDFSNILAGEFSCKVVFISRSTGETSTVRGIFDETLETIEQDGGITLNSMFARVTVFVPDLDFIPAQHDFIDIYPFGNDATSSVRWRIHSYDPESEGNVVIPLIKDD